MKYIDLDNWERKKQYDFFREIDYPHFNLCANLDITQFYKYVKAHNLNFYKSILFAIVKTANQIPEFRYRIREDKVVEHEIIHFSSTVVNKANTFSFCDIDFIDDYQKFVDGATERMAAMENTVHVSDVPGKDDLFYITTIPWVSFTSFTHPIHLKKVDSVPRFSIGKYFDQDKKKQMPLSVQANHSLMDGMHMGMYFNKLQEFLDNPEKMV